MDCCSTLFLWSWKKYNVNTDIDKILKKKKQWLKVYKAHIILDSKISYQGENNENIKIYWKKETNTLISAVKSLSKQLKDVTKLM